MTEGPKKPLSREEEIKDPIVDRTQVILNMLNSANYGILDILLRLQQDVIYLEREIEKLKGENNDSKE